MVLWVQDSILLGFEVSVDDAQSMQMVQGQGQLRQVELHVLFCEHHLANRRDRCVSNAVHGQVYVHTYATATIHTYTHTHTLTHKPYLF